MRLSVGDMALITGSKFRPDLIGQVCTIIKPYELRLVRMPDGSKRAIMSYEDTLKIRRTAEFEIVENELWIYHGFDLGDIEKDMTGFFMNRDETVQLRDFLNKWLDGVNVVDTGLSQALRRMLERPKVCPKCRQDPYDGHDMCCTFSG